LGATKSGTVKVGGFLLELALVAARSAPPTFLT